MSEKLNEALGRLQKCREADFYSNVTDFVNILGSLPDKRMEVVFPWTEDTYKDVFNSHRDALEHIELLEDGTAKIRGIVSYSAGYDLIAVDLTDDDEDGPAGLFRPKEIIVLNSVK